MNHSIRKKLLNYFLAAWGALTLNFILPRMMPGDPVEATLGRLKGRLTPEIEEAIRNAMGKAEGNIFEQYWNYLTGIVTGDWGVSVVRFPEQVSTLVWNALGWTLLIAGTALVLSFIIGTFLGVLCARRPGEGIDRWLPPTLIFIGGFPYFWLAMVSVSFLGYSLDWFPVRHAESVEKYFDTTWELMLDRAWHAALPIGTIVIASLGGWLLTMRNAMIGELGTSYVQMAFSKGLSEKRVIFSYAARNALLPSITNLGMALGYVVAGALLTEIVFSYPGQGLLMLEAIRNQDYPLLQGCFATVTFAVLGSNLLLDLLYVFVDPRTRRDGDDS